jgi:hypothetical protein
MTRNAADDLYEGIGSKPKQERKTDEKPSKEPSLLKEGRPQREPNPGEYEILGGTPESRREARNAK